MRQLLRERVKTCCFYPSFGEEEEEEERYEEEYGELEWCKKWYILEQAIND